jgi:hypothetical protein
MSGRNQASQIAQTYIHLTGGDTRKKLLQKRGIIKPDEMMVSNPMQPIKCWSCGTENPANNILCFNNECNMPLRVSEAQKDRFNEASKNMMVVRTFNKLEEKEPEAFNILLGALEQINNVLKAKKQE